jgi:hypothetical protein
LLRGKKEKHYFISFQTVALTAAVTAAALKKQKFG